MSVNLSVCIVVISLTVCHAFSFVPASPSICVNRHNVPVLGTVRTSVPLFPGSLRATPNVRLMMAATSKPASPTPRKSVAAPPAKQVAPVQPKVPIAEAVKPKRPLSSFFLFSAEKRPSIKSQFPDLTNTEVVSKLGEMWKAASPNEKKPYELKAAKARAEYDALYKQDKVDAPKKPLSAYMMYSNDIRATVKLANPTANFGDIARIIGAQWKKLTDAQKKKYVDAQEKEKKAFNARKVA